MYKIVTMIGFNTKKIDPPETQVDLVIRCFLCYPTILINNRIKR